MSVQKFTSIPVEVEAIQFTGENSKEIKEWANNVSQNSVYITELPDLSTRLAINTKEGEMLVSVGDYVVKEPFPTGDRDFYPCKQDIFEKRYRKS